MATKHVNYIQIPLENMDTEVTCLCFVKVYESRNGHRLKIFISVRI
jgi:hypothetical protein